MKERILCRKVMAWLMAAFMVITCLVSIGGKNTAYASVMENIKVTDVDISTDGYLRGLKWGWTTSGYASASCKLGIQSTKFASSDLTDYGVYLKSHKYNGWASAESPADCGFKGWITESAFSRSSGTYDRTDTVSGDGIDMGTMGVYYLYTWTYYSGYVFPDIYIGSIDLDAGKIVDASGNEITFQIGGFSDGGNTDPSEDEVVFMNNGYPYGKNMTLASIDLVMDVTGEAATYQWQSAINKRGPFTDIEGANESTYQFKPTHGNWYRCVVDGTASRAVKAVLPSSDDGNTWTKPNSCWYISNGVMAYMVNGNMFDIVGLYSKDGTNYMLGTSYDKVWSLYSRSGSEPSAEMAASVSSEASLAALRLSFDPMNTHDLIFDAELGEGQHSFAIGADANIGNSITSSGSADKAVLAATVKNGELQQMAMMGVAEAADATDDTPSFVLAPITQASYYWIGVYDSRKVFAYNTGSSSYIKETAEINGQNVASLVEGTDSGLTMSWTNIEDGGHVGFKFSVGAVADVGAVTGHVDYITEKVIDLEEDTSYIITVDGETYDIVSDMYGEIDIEGTDDNGKSYSLFGKNISISKKDSQDTPADITVAARPDAPSAPKDLADIQNPTPADLENAADGGVVEIVSVTGDSVTVSPLSGQQYQYSVDGENWTALDDLNVSDNYIISGLEEGQKVYVRTRYVANTTRPASLWSDAKEVSNDLFAGVTAEDITCTYDGMIHSPSVTIADGLEGASISYSLAENEPYTEAVPELKKAGTYKVYYLVTADGCSPVFDYVTVTIEKKTITAEKILMYGYMSISGVEFSGLVDGETLEYRTDYSVYAHSTSVEAPKFIANYVVFLEGTDAASNYTLENTMVEMVHTHDWQYVPYGDEGNMINAYCAETETVEMCGYQLEGGRPMVFSMTADNSQYNGEEYTGLTYRDYVTETTGAKLEILYEGTGDTDYPASETAPTNAGTYRVVAKIGNTTAQVTFEIQRADQSAELSIGDYTFGDSIEGPKVTGANEDPVVEYYYTTENSNTDGTLWENSRSADPGTYYMYAKIGATTNYNEYVTQPVQFTVAKGENSSDIMAEDVVKTYDGKAYGITVTGDIPEDAVVTYGTSEDACNDIESPKYSQASDEPYTVYYKVAARGYDTITGHATITINRRPLAVSGIKAANKVYDGKKTVKLDYSGIVLKGKVSADALTVTATGAFDSADAGTGKTVSISDIKISGKAASNYVLTEDARQQTAKADITPAGTTLTVGKVAAKTYGGAQFALSVKCNRNDKKTFASSNTKVVKVDSTGKVTIVGAGKAVVTVSVAANKNYKAATAKVAITVNKKAVRVTANDASKYEGKADPKFTYTAEGLVGKDKLTGIVLKRAAGEKSGTYTITASQKQGANPNYNITFAIGRLVIKKAPNVELSGAELCKKSLPFFVMRGKGTGTRIDLTWSKVSGATGYDVYWSYCNGKNNFNKLGNVTKSLKYSDKNLNSKREYKYFTVAYKMSGGKKVYLGKTNIVHVAMPYASRTNALTVTVNKTAVSLAKGKTFKITKKVKLEDPKKKALSHFLKNELFITSNAKVATVSSAGVIKAVGKGTCTVYAMSENGVCAKIKVTVK